MTRICQTKVVATIGPASQSEEILSALISGGADVLRLNFSHGTREDHAELIRRIRKVSAALSQEVAVMQDLCGPKIRLGSVRGDNLHLSTGTEVRFVMEDIECTSERLALNQPKVISELAAGNRVLINDGVVELTVLKPGAEAICRVTRGGEIASAKGVNFPDTDLSLPSVTEKDLEDLEVGISEGVDFVALSFVRRAEDLDPVRKRLAEAKCKAQLIAKIEKPEAVSNIDSVIKASDGVLVARGDLGVETALQEVPFLQKEIVRKANEHDKYVIVATQMLESMAENAVPTRAEVSDVANAILDGADAVMLSVETSAGKYPVEALSEMVSIAARTDQYAAVNRPSWNWDEVNPQHKVLDAVGHAVQKFSEDLNPAAIITYSPTGGTALFVSKNRPACPIIAFTPSVGSSRRMRIFWGVEPVVRELADADDLAQAGREYLQKSGLAERPLSAHRADSTQRCFRVISVLWADRCSVVSMKRVF
jgi:pyruvate kinase